MQQKTYIITIITSNCFINRHRMNFKGISLLYAACTIVVHRLIRHCLQNIEFHKRYYSSSFLFGQLWKLVWSNWLTKSRCNCFGFVKVCRKSYERGVMGFDVLTCVLGSFVVIAVEMMFVRQLEPSMRWF